jgi:septal ring factor EnvC (AmiA/AmiB activator)
LTLLIARKEPRRHPRVRWLLRYLEEDEEATIDELVLAASCLAALTGNRHQEAAQALRDMTEKATRRRRRRGDA